jgi:hypothetical protein
VLVAGLEKYDRFFGSNASTCVDLRGNVMGNVMTLFNDA